jgi:predicted RNA-binding protein with EMAP domain
METKEIIKIIKTKKNWESKELIELIKSTEQKHIRIEFCHIGGYELMRDGTQTEVCKSLKEIQCFLDGEEIEYDKTIKDPIKLVKSIEKEWAEIWDDGGGRGWIEY